MPDQPTIADPFQTQPAPEPIRSFGGYEILRELGRGGMGVVYLARQTELNRLVALKMLTGHYGPHELHRFKEEAETAAGLSHSSIAHIYEIGEHEGAPFFSMEYVEDGSLADRLRKELPTPRETAQLLVRVARGLQQAHQAGIVHRDLKPANILIDEDGTPKIADFGIAKRLDDETHLTRSGAVIGTPTYMAPEQARGDSRHVGPAADIYSLGAILYEMLTGRPPFLPEDSEMAVTVRVLTEDPVSPAWHRPGVPRDLETICLKCLEKHPHLRYATATDLANDIEHFLNDESIKAKPPSTILRSVKWVRRNPWKSVGAGLVALLLVAGVLRLAQWELYQRPHVEYATQLVWVNGALAPVKQLSLADASKHPDYLRVTRRGWYGPVTKIEVLNARGNPAVLRPILIEDMVPLYIEGLTGSQPYAERSPESTTVEFTYTGGIRPAEAIGHDRNGQVNWRIIYDLATPVPPDQIARARFVNLSGFDAVSRGGASYLGFERDPKGFDRKVYFFNAAGKPAPNGEGVYGYELEYNDVGQITRLVNLGADGKPAPNRAGLTGYTISLGKEIRLQIRDAQGQPAPWNGIATIVSELDPAQNPTRVTFLGADGKPVPGEKTAWSAQELRLNEHGEIASRTYLKTDSSGALKQSSQMTFTYDDFGYPADVRYAGETAWRSALHHDRNGNITEETYLDGNGAPKLGDRGYATRRLTYSAGPQGLRIEETYFDAAGNNTYNSGGYHRLISEFNLAGSLRRLTADQHDPARFKYYRQVNEPEYDPQGKLIHSVHEYEDAQGNLAVNAGIPFSRSEEFFDDQGRRVRLLETGFDENAVGFSSRETKLSGADAPQVVHRKSDGTVVQAVLVFIAAVKPPAAQPTASELKQGDQLLNINGKPITSAYAFIYGPAFTGGNVEVLRDGKHLVIEGFKSGDLGVTLEDRALPSKP
jgi:predicted Ser/Thr protein kinase